MLNFAKVRWTQKQENSHVLVLDLVLTESRCRWTLTQENKVKKFQKWWFRSQTLWTEMKSRLWVWPDVFRTWQFNILYVSGTFLVWFWCSGHRMESNLIKFIFKESAEIMIKIHFISKPALKCTHFRPRLLIQSRNQLICLKEAAMLSCYCLKSFLCAEGFLGFMSAASFTFSSLFFL